MAPTLLFQIHQGCKFDQFLLRASDQGFASLRVGLSRWSVAIWSPKYQYPVGRICCIATAPNCWWRSFPETLRFVVSCHKSCHEWDLR